MNETGPQTDEARPPRWRGWSVNILLILAIFAAVQWWKARPLASGEAPALAGPALDGRPLDLVQLRGQSVLVHFWATWCPVCKAMDGTIDAIAQDYRVVTVAMQSGDAAEIRAYLINQGLSFPVVADESGALASRWGVPGVPATFVLDETGRIAYSTLGLSTEAGLRARLWASARPE